MKITYPGTAIDDTDAERLFAGPQSVQVTELSYRKRSVCVFNHKNGLGNRVAFFEIMPKDFIADQKLHKEDVMFLCHRVRYFAHLDGDFIALLDNNWNVFLLCRIHGVGNKFLHRLSAAENGWFAVPQAFDYIPANTAFVNALLSQHISSLSIRA
jgi:hypothetical protein